MQSALVWFGLYITNKWLKHQSFVYTQLNDQIIQFIMSHLFVLSLNVKEFYLTLSSATTLGQSGPRSNGNERVFCIPQRSCITGASLSDCLMSYQDTHLWNLTPLQMQSAYSTAPADWAIWILIGIHVRYASIWTSW